MEKRFHRVQCAHGEFNRGDIYMHIDSEELVAELINLVDSIPFLAGWKLIGVSFIEYFIIKRISKQATAYKY